MQVKITEIREHQEGVEIKAVVFWRGFARPDYSNNETDEEYEKRVWETAQEIEEYRNLHIGFGKLRQAVEKVAIPTVEEYDS